MTKNGKFKMIDFNDKVFIRQTTPISIPGIGDYVLYPFVYEKEYELNGAFSMLNYGGCEDGRQLLESIKDNKKVGLNPSLISGNIGKPIIIRTEDEIIKVVQKVINESWILSRIALLIFRIWYFG